jgi:hypothetical protein
VTLNIYLWWAATPPGTVLSLPVPSPDKGGGESPSYIQFHQFILFSSPDKGRGQSQSYIQFHLFFFFFFYFSARIKELSHSLISNSINLFLLLFSPDKGVESLSYIQFHQFIFFSSLDNGRGEWQSYIQLHLSFFILRFSPDKGVDSQSYIQFHQFFFPDRIKAIQLSVCVSVCLRKLRHISESSEPNCTIFFSQPSLRRGTDNAVKSVDSTYLLRSVKWRKVAKKAKIVCATGISHKVINRTAQFLFQSLVCYRALVTSHIS